MIFSKEMDFHTFQGNIRRRTRNLSETDAVAPVGTDTLVTGKKTEILESLRRHSWPAPLRSSERNEPNTAYKQLRTVGCGL